jgi:hypothetical protein
MTETAHDVKAILAKAIAKLPKQTYLTFIDRNDNLTDEQCAKIIGGEKDDIVDNFDFFENEIGSIESYLDDCLPDEDEREALKNSESEYQEFKDECYERDNSTPYADLLRNTTRQLVRFYIRTKAGERVAMEGDSWQWDSERVDREARRLGKFAGLDFATNAEALRELVVNATYGGILCVIAYVEMSDVDSWVEYLLQGDERRRVKLTFTDPQLLLHDPWNGSGHDVKVSGQIQVKFGKAALESGHYGAMSLDAKGVGTGYSWDETAGVYKPAYKADPAAKLYTVSAKAKPDCTAPESWPGR